MAETKMADYRSIVQKTADAYIPIIEQALSTAANPTDGYQHQCMANALVAIDTAAADAGLESLAAFDKKEIMAILQQVAAMRLNAFSMPRECYFTTRKKKRSDGSWGVSIEMGVEGDGFDGMLQNFGRNVETVFPYWAVREDDEFEYPVHHGVEVQPPVWRPSGHGKYVRVVYPIRFKDGDIQYFIGERADVRANLVAHISNNMMNETFGIAESRHKATMEQKLQIDARKAELKALMDGKSVDEILDIPELQPYISPAWRDGSRERMILRKMRNNVVKAIPKNFASGAAMAAYRSVEAAEAGSIDAEFRVMDEPAPLPPVQEPSPDEPKPVKNEPATTADKPKRTAPAAAPF